MKRLFFLAIAFWSGAAPLWADYQKGSHTLSLQAGVASYSDNYDIYHGENRLRDEGGALGAQYLYYFRSSPTLGWGIDLLGTGFTDEHASGLLPNSESKAEAETGFFQIVTKLTYPSGFFRPYVLLGAGAARSSLQAHVTPGTGALWGDTQTAEVRQTFDSAKTGGVFTWAVGTDLFVGKRIFLGAEFRQSVLPRRTHQPTAFGASRGISPVREPPAWTALLFKLGVKFGA